VYTVNQIPSTPASKDRRVRGQTPASTDQSMRQKKVPRRRRLGGLVPADQPRKRGAPVMLPLRRCRAPRRPEVVTLWHHRFSFRSSDNPFRRGCRRGPAGRREAADAVAADAILIPRLRVRRRNTRMPHACPWRSGDRS
jgi:hypothetical protein